MDGKQFDSLTRRLAGGMTRRAAIRGGAAGVLGALGLLRAADAQVSQAQCGNVACKNNPGKCAPGCVCCVHANGNSRCQPPGKCSGGSEICPADRPFIDLGRGCVQCLNAGQCPAASGPCQVPVCTAGVCGFAPNTAVCRSASCADGVATLAERCSGTGAACPTVRTQPCAPYRCAGTACATNCATDGDCAGGYHCDEGQCLLDAGLGAPCDEASDCESDFCVDGVCCNMACAGACETCIGATPGVCTTTPCATPGTCQTGPGTCNPQSGACDYPPANDGTACGTGGTQECCGGACCATGETCAGGTCQAATCISVGNICNTTDNRCCAADPTCAQSCSGFPTCCRQPGGTCEDTCDCCGSDSLCSGGTCCRPLSGACDADADCCGELVCNGGTCQEFCLAVGTACSASSEAPCCDSTICNGIETQVCDKPFGTYCTRRPLEACASDCECGVFFPKVAPYVGTACENGRCCLPLGRLCASAQDCCQSGPDVACQPSDTPGTGGGPDDPVCCIPDGGPCSDPLHFCCNGSCVAGQCGGAD